MKFLRNLFDGLHDKIEGSSKLSKYKPVVNAFDTIFFTPNETTHSGSHIRDGADLKRTMGTVVIALIPCLLFGMYNAGYQHLVQLEGSAAFLDTFLLGAQKIVPLIIVSYTVGLGVEFLSAVIRGHEVNEGFLVTGMLIPLIVPVDIPLWMLALSVVFAVVIGKEAFGGTGMNILNPALVSRAFLFFAYPTYMSGNKIWVIDASTMDAVSGETILGNIAAGNDAGYSVMEMITGLIPGSVGETSIIAIAIGAFILILSGVGSWRIMVSAIIGGLVMGLIFNAFGINSLMRFEFWQHILVGGFAFGIVFMATDPVSATQTQKGKYIYGFLVGLFSIMIRVFNPAYPEGVMLAILFMNVMAPTIDHFVIEANIKKRKKRLKIAQMNLN